jgi:tetratricopeptide (TPR) repeat protein
MGEGRRLLAETTTFPRAGEVNWRVARFVESCVQMWERAGYGQYHAKEVIKILWWAIEMTFHSQSVLRHLARLLHATGQHQDARRIFEIYVKLVLKARQTAQPDVVLQLKSNKVDDELTAAEAVAKEAKETDEKPMEGAEVEMDSDIDLIKTLVFGARLFTREIENPSEAWRYAVLAGDVISLNSSSFDKDVHARVEQCKGTVRMAMAYYDGDVSTRPTLQAQGVAHLIAASKLSPSNPLIKYHLAYAQAEAREIASALDTVREAIELLPTNVEAWHLLALMLTATKDWTGALKATSAGISTWEANERDLALQQPITESGIIAADPVGVSSRDFAQDATNDTESFQVAVPTPIIVGQSVSPNPVLATSVPLIPAVVTARLAVVIQLRMTQAVIVEKLDGVEGAMMTQQDTFAYFSSRSGYARPGEPDTAGSADGGSVRDLGESFFSVNETAPAGVPPIAESMLCECSCWQSRWRLFTSCYNF